MSLFLFHLSECGDVTLDEEGRELVGLAEAHCHAVHDAREIMCSDVAQGSLNLACHIDIVDHTGVALLAVPFTLAVRVSR